jgi:hypothetical protein
MDLKKLGTALAGLIFMAVAVWDFSHDTSGIGVVFLVLGAVFLGQAFSSGRRT